MKSNKHKTVHLPVIVEQDEDNIYIVSCPVFKGCHSYGKTIEEENENKEITSNSFIGFRELEVSLKKLRA